MNPDQSPNPSSSPLPAEPSPDSAWESRDLRGRLDRPHRHDRVHGVVIGLTVIAWGGLLLLREAGVIDRSVHVLAFWPLLLVAFGVSALIRRRSAGAVLVGVAVGLVGLGMLAERLGYIEAGVYHLWPLLVIAAGVAMVLRGSARRRPRWNSGETVSTDVLQRSVTMGSLELAVDSQQFKGAALGATMGEVKVDLRRAAMSGGEVAVDLSVVMGGIELYVPGNWQVVSDVSPFMGVVEDRTDPRPDASGVQKRLVLRGSITMGAVTIKS